MKKTREELEKEYAEATAKAEQYQHRGQRYENRNRYYTQADIDTVKQIRYLRDELHITRIEAIRRELQRGSRQTDVKQRATEILTRVRQELIEIRTMI